MQLGNGNWESTQFNPRLQPVQIALGTTQHATDLLKLEYGYGTTANNGNVLSQKITVPGLAHPFEQTYAYDSLNRLASATETYNSTQTWTQVFGYDRYGNRNITSGTGATSLTFNASNNRITSNGYTFDASGNTTADPSGQTFVYDAENKQTSVSSGGTTLGTYFFDGDGKRVKKTASTGDNIIFIYDAFDKLIEERDSTTGTLQTSYVYAGSRLLSTETSLGTTYLTADHLGSPRINTDGSGNVVARHDYLPFGEEIFTALTAQRTSGVGYVGDGVRKQFTGYERDIETDLDFAQARVYNKNHGRFTAADPLMASAEIVNPQTFDRYAYVGNNPINLTDPTGEIWGQLNGSLQWFKNQAALEAAGYSNYNALVGMVNGGLVVLSATANSYTAVANAEEALRLIAASGATAAALEASAVALGYVVVAAGAGYLVYKAAEYNAEHPEQVRVWGCPAIADCPVNVERQIFGEHAPWVLKMGSTREGGNTVSGDESSPADPNASKPNPEDNKASAGSSKPPGHDKDWVKLRGGQGYRDPDGNIWKKDMLHKDHWDVSDRKGNKIKEVDFNGRQIWPGGPKNKNK